MRKLPPIVFCLSLLSGCSDVDPAIDNCSRLAHVYLDNAPTRERFVSYAPEIQYELMICGSQYLHPPMLLTNFVASEGASMVPILQRKLQATNHDQTIADIVRTFVEMKRQGTYNVSANTELIAILGEKVQRMRDGFRRDRSVEDFAFIQSRGYR